MGWAYPACLWPFLRVFLSSLPLVSPLIPYFSDIEQNEKGIDSTGIIRPEFLLWINSDEIHDHPGYFEGVVTECLNAVTDGIKEQEDEADRQVSFQEATPSISTTRRTVPILELVKVAGRASIVLALSQSYCSWTFPTTAGEPNCILDEPRLRALHHV